jgi:hypothetical protein
MATRVFNAKCSCTDGICQCHDPHGEEIETGIAGIVAAALQSMDEGTDVRVQLDDGRSFPTHLKHAELTAIERHPSIHRVA